ncbi:complexed with cef1p [Ascochyta clinopodiicola]|nr:complexed with cef1p [Ascochyta clinopodiicola]
MTTAHRPTFDPARGKEAQRGPAYHQRLLPAHTTLKHRQAGQGGDADGYQRDLRAELLEAEARHYAKKNGTYVEPEAAADPSSAPKRQIDAVAAEDGDEDEADAKRRRIEMLEKYRDVDADDSSEGGESSEEEDDSEDEEDEADALVRELEKIKKERAEAKAKEERERAVEEEEQREIDVARGNPLLNAKDFTMKRRWDDDVVFKNQARGTEDRNKKKEFINDMLRSDFHKKFMVSVNYAVHAFELADMLQQSKYVR